MPRTRSLFRRDHPARFSGGHRSTQWRVSDLRYVGLDLNKRRPSIRRFGCRSDLRMGSAEWSGSEVATGAAIGCLVIAGLSTSITLALFLGAIGIQLLLFAVFKLK